MLEENEQKRKNSFVDENSVENLFQRFWNKEIFNPRCLTMTTRMTNW